MLTLKESNLTLLQHSVAIAIFPSIIHLSHNVVALPSMILVSPMATALNNVNASLHAAAAERRLVHPSQPHLKKASYTAFDENHQTRTKFRRIINEDILRHNSRDISMKSLEILLELSQNIITHPDEVRYLRIKPTNNTIMKYIMKPRGTAEYARAVKDLQPYYTFDKKRMVDLCIGSEILKTRLKEEQDRVEEEELAPLRERAQKAAVHAQTMRKVMDDRKTVALRTQREIEQASVRKSTPSVQSISRPLGSTAGRLKY
ncbi:hypothetical protein EUX98_g5238 [Antrodiella citrinella]|uniref:Uncharacterized protein n=1 Tax=Antrodiella citrinella TaxID=2447956 RepID=A0A4V3XIE7_9APHY|nr:hypothetical protein EUX98_g5238 [Antrodiella citrinella]